MATIKELREQAASTLADARSMLDAISDKSTPEQRTEAEQSVDKALTAASGLEAQAERLENLEAAEKRLSENAERKEKETRKKKRPENNNVEDRSNEGELYRSAFAKFACGAELTTEDRSVLKSRESRAQTAGSNAGGGYTVPIELMPEIEIALAASGPMYNSDICRVFNTPSGNPMTLPTIDDTAIVSETYTEASTGTDDGGKDVVIGQKQLDSFSFDTEWVRWSYELDNDSDFSFESLLAELLGERMGRTGNAQLTTGTGSSAPNGIVTAAALGKTAAGVAAVTADEILDLYHSVDPRYRASAKSRIMFNDSTLLALHKLKDGQGNYLFRDSPDFAGQLVIGSVRIPYSINQDMESMATGNKSMVYGDFGKYFVRRVGSPVLFVARERFAPSLGILGLHRFDGELSNTGAVKHLIQA